MAKDYEEFSKAFKKIDQSFESIAQEIKKNERAVGQTTGVVHEGIKVLGNRIQELKDRGTNGTKVSDFISDPEAKSLWGAIEGYMSGLQKEIQRITLIHNGVAKGTKSDFIELKKNLAAEIKKRKQDKTTKLGLGNKSLPDLEKLLKELDTYESKAPYATVAYFNPETFEDHQRQIDKLVQKEIAQAKDVKLSEEQKMLDEQALNVRNLLANLARAKKLHDAILVTCESAKTAIEQRDQRALMTAKAELPKPLKELGDLAQIGERALKDTWIKRGIEDSKDKTKILSGIKGIADYKKAASDAVKEVANARL